MTIALLVARVAGWWPRTIPLVWQRSQ